MPDYGDTGTYRLYNPRDVYKRQDNSLLCELAVHPDFPRLMADLEVYVNGIAGKQVQSANAIVDAVSAVSYTHLSLVNQGLFSP